MSVINEKQLDNINKQLEGVTHSLDKVFADLEKRLSKTNTVSQDEIDKLGEQVSEKLQLQTDKIRAKIIDVFSEQAKVIKKKIEPIEPLLNVSLSIDTVVSVVKSIIDIITAPYEPYIEYTTNIMPKIIELSDNLQKIANYTPNVTLPEGINPPKINVKIEPITVKDILG